MFAWEPLWMDLPPEIFLSVNNMTIHDITYIFLDLLEQLRVQTYHLVVTSHQQVLSFFSNSACSPRPLLIRLNKSVLPPHRHFSDAPITLLRNYINAKIPVADAHFIPFCIYPSISPKNQFLDPDLLCSYNSTGMDASSQLQLRHAKVAKAGFLFTKSRALSLSTHSSDEALHVERVQLYCQPHGQKILDEADGTTANLVYLLNLQRQIHPLSRLFPLSNSALREADERAVALVAAVAVLSEPEQILVNTEELVKNWKYTTPSPHSPQRVSGRAGLVRCEVCRWEGRKDFDPALPFDASLLSTADIETIATFVRADRQKKGISPHPISTQHLRQFISSPTIRQYLSLRVLAGIKEAETRA
ncbi:hypothetical protein BLNAU_19266 [Blattamonas nauphoetae]|uniref:Uncharacterized protein n=1 Tax=Blattamonas nauphoetae TaxID=2049346 RepID=A0ABQ9X2H6_9EUKA|nr:hypothetical protein BLNAU_19266 [Blattamonas nauphoetae]